MPQYQIGTVRFQVSALPLLVAVHDLDSSTSTRPSIDAVHERWYSIPTSRSLRFQFIS